MIYLLTTKNFIDDAAEYCKTLPLEKGIYKKYSVAMPLELADEKASAQGGAGIEKLATDISEKTRIKFDAIISDSFVKNITNKIAIVGVDKITPEILDAKMFKSSEDKLGAFVNAKATQYLIVDVKPGASEKINLLFLNDASLSVQILIMAHTNSRLEMLEFYGSDSKKHSIVSAMHEIDAKSDSHIEIDALHNENENTYVVGLCKAKVADKARLKLNFVYNGSTSTKVRNIIDSCGMNNSVEVTEVVFGSSEQKFDLSSAIENSKPHSRGWIDSGVVLNDKSQCMLKGYAKIANGSKGAFSKITERGILLSKDAHIDALPDMSIDFSNEVKATHSAATSPIDKEILFYLTSRGIEESEARRLFVTSFLAKYLLNMENGVAKEVAMSMMLEKLEKNVFGVLSEVTPKGIWLASRN